MARRPPDDRRTYDRPTYERRPYQRRGSYGPLIGIAVAAVLIVVAFVVFQKHEASKPPPSATPKVDPDLQRRREEMAAREKEQRRQHNIRVLRQKLARVDRQIASNQERLKDAYSWTRDRDLAEAKDLAAERAGIVEELAQLGEEP